MPRADRLHLSQDRKVAPRGSHAGFLPNGRDRGYVATISNSFGLPAGKTCPGATAFCVSCYAANAEQYRDQVGRAMMHNLEMLFACEDDPLEMAALLQEAVGRFDRQFGRTGLPERDRVFRIHWDGDFFSQNYAAAWWLTARKYPRIKFWTYTRSFTEECNVVPYLQGLDNLVVFLSTDVHNVERARYVKEMHPWVRLALCAVDYRTGRELGVAKHRIVCPENKGALPLMNEQGRGACVECRLCLRGSSDIIFSTSHAEDLVHGQGRFFDGTVGTPPVDIPVALPVPRRRTP